MYVLRVVLPTVPFHFYIYTFFCCKNLHFCVMQQKSGSHSDNMTQRGMEIGIIAHWRCGVWCVAKCNVNVLNDAVHGTPCDVTVTRTRRQAGKHMSQAHPSLYVKHSF